MTFIVLVVVTIAASTFVGAVNRPPANGAPAAVTSAARPAKSTTRPAPRPVAARVGPSPERVLFAVTGRKYCIGGTLCPSYCAQPTNSCEVEPIYRIGLERPAEISRIQLYAYNDVGVTHVAELVVRLDGMAIGTLPVRWQGGTLDLPVRLTGQRITIEARDSSGSRFAGEEAVISDVKVFGRTVK
jgi:hypothetical protein